MLLTPEQKQKYLAYLEARKNKTEKAPKTEEKSTAEVEPTDLISWCVADMLESGADKSKEADFYSYIFEYAMQNLNSSIEPEDIENYNQYLNTEEVDKFYMSLFSESKYVQIFTLGIIYAYIKLCSSLKIQSNPEIESISDAVFQLFN
jgi:hypothetical protein